MAKITLEFDLYEEREEYMSAVLGGEYKALIKDLDQFLRNEIKYGSNKAKGKYYEKLRDKLYELLMESDLKIE